MGGSSSKSRSQVFNDTVNNVIVKNIMDCSSNVTLQQQINITGSGNVVSGVTMNQAIKLSSTCFQDAKVMADLQNQVTDAIKQAAKEQDVALTNALAKSSSDTDTLIHNSVVNNINPQNITKIINSSNEIQGINITGDYNLVSNFTASQTADVVSSNTQKVIDQMDVVNQIKDYIDQQASTTVNNPISQIIDSAGKAISSIWDSMTAPVKWILIVVIVAVVGYIISLFMGPTDNAEQQQQLVAAYMAAQSTTPESQPKETEGQ